MSVRAVLLSIFTFFFCFSGCYAVVIGSDTQSSIEPFVTFPAADSNNIILAFAWMQNGFALEDSSTTVTFNSVYPVSGSVNLNGGTLYLQKDMALKNETTLQGLGHVVGNTYTLNVCSCISALPADTRSFKDTHIVLNSDVIMTSTITFYGNCVIEGNGNVLELEDNAQIIVAAGSSLRFRNIFVEGIAGRNIMCADDTARLELDHMHFDLHADFIFDVGSITFMDNVVFEGAYTFLYDSAQTSTITRHSRWCIAEEMHIQIGRKSIGAPEPLYFESQKSILHLDHCTFEVTAGGLTLSHGTLMFDRDITVIMNSTSFANGIQVGNGVAEDDMAVQFNAGTVVRHTGGHMTFNCVNPNFMQTATSKGARLVRGQTAYTYVAKSMVLPAIAIEVVSTTVPPILAAPGAMIEYDGVQVSLPGVEFDLHATQLNSFTYILDGGDSLFFSRGVLPLYLVIQNTNNRIQGNGGTSGLVTLANDGAELRYNMTGAISNNVMLNGGRIVLEDNLRLGNNGQIVGPGLAQLGASMLQLPINLSSWNTPITWQGNSGWISMGAVTTLSNVWTVSGSVIIDGGYNTLTLSGTGALEVMPGSRLTLRHMRIKGLKRDNIRCLDDSASITLIDVDMALDDDFTFTIGKMRCVNKVSVSGAHNFIYDSAHTSTVDAQSELVFQKGAHVHIGKKTENGRQPLYFTDKTSVLRLNDADLTITNSGWNGLRGTMVFEQTVRLDVVATNTSHGFIWGDGVNVDNDFEMQFGSGANAVFAAGYFTYNNTVPNKLVALARNATITRYADATFYLPKSLTFPSMGIGIDTPDIPVVILEPTTNLLLDKSIVKLPGVEVVFTGRQVDLETIALEGNNSLSIANGPFYSLILVSGDNNMISGVGSIETPIVFTGPTAKLGTTMGGTLGGAIMLNGGTLALLDDLVLANNSTLIGPGLVSLGTNVLTLGQQSSSYIQPILWAGNNAAITMRADVQLESQWTVTGSLVVQGNGNTLTLGDLGSIVIAPGSSLTLKDMYLIGPKDRNILCADDTSKLALNNVTWVQDYDFTFTTGSISFQNTVDFQGANKFVYESCCTCTIESNATWLINSGMTLSIGRRTPTSSNPLFFADETAELKLDNCKLSVTPNGMQTAYGKVTYYRNVTVEINSTNVSNGMILGDGVSTLPMLLEFAPGATVHFTKGHLTFNSLYPTAISSISQTSLMLRDAASYFNTLQNTVLSNISIKAGPYSTLVLAPGKTLTFDNCAIQVPTGEFILSGMRYSSFMNLLPGNGSIFLTKGSMPTYTLVMGTGNAINGNGTITGGIILANSAAQLLYGVNGSLANNITLNGGTLTLGSDLNLLQNYQIIGSGVVDIGLHKIEMAYQDTVWTSPVYWRSNYGALHINEEFELRSTWTFQGYCTLEGHGETLTLGTGGKIVVDSNSTLVLKDISLQNIAASNIICVDDTATIILEDVRWSQSSNFVFAQGSLQFKNGVDLVGAYEFLYSTVKTSSILSQTKVTCDDGFTLRYDPADQEQDHLQMIDATSLFVLNSAELQVGLGGMNLTHGRLRIKGDSIIRSDFVIDFDAIVQSIGLIIGDGSAENDCVCEITNGAQCNVVAGSLHYRNAVQTSWRSFNNLSTLYMHPFTTLFIDRALNIGNGRLLMSDAARIVTTTCKKLVGSVTIVE